MILQMKEHGKFLGSRALGERVRTQVLGLLRSAPDRVVLDFVGVQGMTQAFADELFRKLIEDGQDVAKLAVSNLNDDMLAVLRYVTSK